MWENVDKFIRREEGRVSFVKSCIDDILKKFFIFREGGEDFVVRFGFF